MKSPQNLNFSDEELIRQLLVLAKIYQKSSFYVYSIDAFEEINLELFILASMY